jgi:hypothetical protein
MLGSERRGFVKLPWSRPSSDEVRAVAIDLIMRHGAGASEEALHLADIALQLGSQANSRLYWRAANYIETHLHEPGSAGRKRKATPQ